MGLVGIPYRWAGNTPATGFDCSGLVQYVFARAADVKLPRTTAELSLRGQAIDPHEIASGDLVFFNTSGRPHSHVGIYIGNLRFVNAPSTGGVVRLDYLTNPYWANRFDGIRRVAPPLQPPAPFDAPTYLAAPQSPASPAAAPARADIGRQTVAEEAADALARAQRYQPWIHEDMERQDAADSSMTRPPSATPRPDAIDAAADAFEPPPPAAALAAQQALRASARDVTPPQSTRDVQVMRASTRPAPTSTDADPISRFAAGDQ